MIRILVFSLLPALMPSFGCSLAAAKKTDPVSKVHKESVRPARLARIALEMLEPGKGKYNPDKGKAYLEYSLKNGHMDTLDVPAPVLLELLRSERVALDKSKALEQQLEIMKEIDRTKEGEM